MLSGQREAELTALGVVSGFHRPDGIVGDLGGGSLELVDVHGARARDRHHAAARRPRAAGPLGALDQEGREARRGARSTSCRCSKGGKGRTFYAIGGTWRSLARLHMAQTGYPLHVMHGYVIRGQGGAGVLPAGAPGQSGDAVADRGGRLRPPAAAAPMRALVLEQSSREAEPRDVVFSALGVREGLLYSLLDAEERKQDPLIAAAERAQRAALALAAARRGADRLDRRASWRLRHRRERRGEAAAPRRLPARRHRLARASRNIAASSRSTSSRTPPSSASTIPAAPIIALAIFFRHVGLLHDEELSPRLRELASTRMLDRARVLGAALRVAYLVSASQPGVLPRTPLKVERHRLVLRLEGECAALAGERAVVAAASSSRAWSAASR